MAKLALPYPMLDPEGMKQVLYAVVYKTELGWFVDTSDIGSKAEAIRIAKAVLCEKRAKVRVVRDTMTTEIVWRSNASVACLRVRPVSVL